MAPPTAPSPYSSDAGPLSTSMRSNRKLSSGRDDCEAVFWRMPSRMTVMSLPAKPRVA